MDGQDAVDIDDLVVLGNAVPYEMEDGRRTVCVAGYSSRLGMIRVYPARPDSPVKWWNRLAMPLVRNSRDTRSESWKIHGSKAEWDRLSKKIAVRELLGAKSRRELWSKACRRHRVGCVKDLNDDRLSLGIVKPTIISCHLVERKSYDATMQATLTTETVYKTIHNYRLKPVIRYRCSECRAKKYHEQQILEWGVYEWFRKHPGQEEKVWDNMHLDDPEWDKWFLVGNQARRRNSFMIISAIRFKGAGRGQARLFD